MLNPVFIGHSSCLHVLTHWPDLPEFQYRVWQQTVWWLDFPGGCDCGIVDSNIIFEVDPSKKIGICHNCLLSVEEHVIRIEPLKMIASPTMFLLVISVHFL